ALVAEVTVAVIPNPMPVVMEALAANRVHRRRAAPQVVIHARRSGLRAAYFADAGAGFVAEAADDGHFAEVAAVNPFDGFLDGLAGAALRAGLDDSVVFARRSDQLAAFPDVVGNGLLDIDILAGLHRPDGGEG